MKAFILAAGLGTRLRSIGLNVPKVMVPVGGRPLLHHHLDLFRSQGITELIVNLHYLPDQITSYFGDGSRYGVRITYSHEPKLLGTAGAVKKMEHELKSGTFLVFYGDNLVRIDFNNLIAFHRDRQALVTIVLFASPEPWTGGVVETDPSGRVTRFVEKPDRSEVTTNLISAGIMVMEPRALQSIPPGQFYDFGKQHLPDLLARGEPLYAMTPNAYVQDVGTPDRLAKAQRDFESGALDVRKGARP